MHNCLITGCGRSGTSMLAGLLRSENYYQGDDYIPPDSSNLKGYHEDREVNAINEEILAEHLRGDWLQTLVGQLTRTIPPNGVRWLARPRHRVSPDKCEHLCDRIEERVSKRPFCYKDPRFSFTLPVWKPLLPSGTRVVVIFRDPMSTARSIVSRIAQRPYARRFRMTLRAAGDVWYCAYQHVLWSMNDSDPDNFLFVHFDNVLNGHAWSQLRAFLGARLDERFPEPALAHQKRDVVRPVPARWAALYERLQMLERYGTGTSIR